MRADPHCAQADGRTPGTRPPYKSQSPATLSAVKPIFQGAVVELGPTQLATKLVDLVLADTGLPEELRHRVSPLRELAEQHPDLAIARLEAEAEAFSAGARYEAPTAQLAKAVTVESFWEHYTDEAVKALIPDPETYRRQLAAAVDPGRMATLDLKQGNLVPASHSWFAQYDAVGGLSGSELINALELGVGRRPPLLLLVLREEGLDGLGIGIRAPHATDAAAAKQTQWRIGGLASGIDEFIDRNIPAEAVERIEWRP